MTHLESTVDQGVCESPSVNSEHLGNKLFIGGELGWPSHSDSVVSRFRNGQQEQAHDRVAEEAPIALVFNGQPYVVMLATPLDLEEFAVGFSLTEGLVKSPDEIMSTRLHLRSEGVEVRIRIPEQRFNESVGKARNLTGRTGCGLCGSATLRQAVRHPDPVGIGCSVAPTDLQTALRQLGDYQTLNRITGAVHAAAWFDLQKRSLIVREDVGRHNALDKLIGALVKRRVNVESGFVVVTSRASYEMVQKCASVGISFMAAISAPTGLAIRLAEETGLTLVGFARGENCVIYANPQRWVN